MFYGLSFPRGTRTSPTRSRCIAAIKPAEKTKLSLLLQEVGLLALLDTRVPNRRRQFDKLEGLVPSTRLAANCIFRNEAIKFKTHRRNFTLYASSFFSPPSIGEVRKVYCRKLYLRDVFFFFCPFFKARAFEWRQAFKFYSAWRRKDGGLVVWGGGGVGGGAQRPTALAVPILSSGKQEVVSQAFPPWSIC